jgi:hypothetical protein
MFKGSIIGGFSFVGKYTSRKFSHPQMILNAFTANSFTRTGRIGTIAMLKIFLLFTIH